MTDLTPLLDTCLKSNGAKGVNKTALTLERLNGFLQEAYQINSRLAELTEYLRSIRRPYLSTAPPPRRQRFAQGNNAHSRDQTYFTNAQRDQIDAEVKSTLRDVHAAVRTLQEAESVRQDTEAALNKRRRQKRGLGSLGTWAAGGAIEDKSPEQQLEEAKAATLNTHREGVIWFLQRKLEQCGREQSDMMEIRIQREVEKRKNVLTPGTVNGFMPTAIRDELSAGNKQGPQGEEVQLPPDQLQILAEENKSMLRLYEDRLDQVRTAEKSLNEISDLQTTLAMNLAGQSAQIEQLVQDSFAAEGNVAGGNKQLKQASERRSTAKLLFFGTAALCSFVLVWDLVI